MPYDRIVVGRITYLTGLSQGHIKSPICDKVGLNGTLNGSLVGYQFCFLQVSQFILQPRFIVAIVSSLLTIPVLNALHP